MFKNVASQKLAVFAYDTSAQEPKTGDAANITAQISKDGGATAATNDANPTELDAADAKGVYIFDLLQAETNADMIVLSAVSGTANITLEPVFINTQTVMRGTDSAALASVLGAAVGASISADIADVPTVAEFEARSIVSADYVVVGDTIAAVTTTGSVSGNVDGSIGSLAAQAKLDVNAEADTALTDYDPPTDTEMAAAFTEIKGGTWAAGTDTLEHIRDKQTDIETDTGEIGAAGAGLSNINLPNQTMDIVGSITGNLSGSVGSVTGAVGSVAAAGITAASLGADCITNAKIADDAIAAENFATNALSADALAADAVTEIWAKAMSDLAGMPNHDASVLDAINILFMALRNKQTAAAAQQTIANDAGATIATAVLSDAAGTTTKGEYA